MAVKNDFDQDSYVQKVDSAHDKLRKLDARVKHIEELTDTTLVLKMFKKDNDLREEFEKVIWKTLVNKAFVGFLWILGAVIVIPLAQKLVGFLWLRFFGTTF